MNRKTYLAGLAILLTAGPALADRLAVVGRNADLVAFIDLESGAVTSTLETGRNPHEIAVDSESRFAYVPPYGGNRITKVDLQTEEQVGQFEIDGHGAMHSAVWMDDALWVTAEEEKVLLKIDPESGEVLARHATGGDVSHMVAAVPLRGSLYTANMGSRTVSAIDAESGALQVITTGAAPEGIDVTPDGRHLWISNRGENTISIINTETNEVERQFSCQGKFPVKLRMRPDGKQVWVANNQSGEVAVFDAESFKHLQTIKVGARPLGIIFSDDSTKGYVSRPGASVVHEIDTSTFEVLRTLDAPGSPDGMVYLPSR